VPLAGLVTAAALALSGCGGSDEASKPAPSSTATGVAKVVDLASAFLGTLSSAQKKEAQQELTEKNATAWSNLPCGSSCRVGVQFSTLSASQLAAAKAVLAAAMGTGSGTGFDQAKKIMLADDVLKSAQASGGSGPGGGTPPSGGAQPSGGAMPSGSAPPNGGSAPSGGPPPSGGAMPSGGNGNGPAGGGYSSGTYFLAMLGTPSVTGTWQLHFGGHHLAVNLTYSNGKVTGSTPFFIGVEPTSWTDKNGTTYAPLSVMRDGMLKLTSSLSSAQLAKAKLSESYTDVLLGPNGNGKFPAKKEGIKVSELSAAQKTLVMAAIKPWVAVVDDATAATLMSEYQSQLDQTSVGFSGNTGLTKQGDYVRIDGPGVWVEFVCQNGVVYQTKIHYHTVYRDHSRDYGGEFSF
jgi:hypothetical protein